MSCRSGKSNTECNSPLFNIRSDSGKTECDSSLFAVGPTHDPSRDWPKTKHSKYARCTKTRQAHFHKLMKIYVYKLTEN